MIKTIKYLAIIISICFIFLKSQALSISKTKQTDNSNIETEEENWEVYLFSSADGPVSNLVNLSAKTEKTKSLNYRGIVKIKINKPNKNGFPTKEEDKILWAIEDALEIYVKKSLGGCYVGRSTYNGQRIFCYYVNNALLLDEKKINGVLEKFKHYNAKCKSKRDKKWSYYYEFLYPSPEDMQCIQNRKVVDNLKRNGDTLAEPRETDHWIYFEDVKNLDRYKKDILKIGFIVREERRLDDGRYSLQIFRKDFVDYRNIDKIVLNLFRLAQKHNAEYDGWETFVVRNKNSKQKK